MKNIQTQIQDYKKIESYSHINLDDIINKVTQEVSELIESDTAWDKIETYKESADVLVNILSVAQELNLDFEINREEKQKDNTKLAIMLGKWNSQIQDLRNRYSRKDIDIKDLEKTTKEFVETILNYSNSESDLKEIIINNSKKFESRKDNYKPNINLNDYIDSYADFPKKWIHFKDISRLLSDPIALDYTINELSLSCKDSDLIVWLDARGFIFWSLVAQKLSKPFIMLRKKWKLPWNTNSIDYWLEYSNSSIEIQTDKIQKWQKVSLIDDLLATWGTIKAAIDLVEKEWWEINNISFVIQLDDEILLNNQNRKDIEKYNINSLIKY